MNKVLVTGALGQIGSELTQKLREIYGVENVLATDIKTDVSLENYITLDVSDRASIELICQEHKITTVYHLAALLSATSEKIPMKAWDLNMNSLLTFLELAKEKKIEKIFWPSSIAIFGEDTPKVNTNQNAVATPTTVYGISKRSGELWCNYYYEKHNVDVRSIRYPGIISWKTLPGGGTTDYAVEIFYKALEEGRYTCFLKEETALPMMYMNDAVNATIQLMQADSNKISTRTSYNLNGISFTPKELAKIIQQHIPNFTINYEPDFRQSIADTWPASIDDSLAKKDWGWQTQFSLEQITVDMLKNLKQKLSIA